MSTEIGAASFGLVVGLNRFRRQLGEAEQTARSSAQRTGEALGGGVEKGMMPGLNRAGKSLENFGGKTMALGGKLTMLGAPLLAAGYAGTRMASDFDESMTKMQSLVGLSAEVVDGFGRDIRRVSDDTGRSQRELADAMFFITSAGLRGAQATEVLEASARAAAVGLGETATIADLVTGAMNAYGAENLSAARAVDVVNAAVREGKMEAGDLAGAMGSLIPTASALNIEFDGVAGVMAAMSRTNSNASENATQLNAVLTLLSRKAGPEAESMLDSVGLSMGQLREMAAGPGGLVEVMRTLDSAFAGNDDALSVLVPNVRAFRGFMSLLAQDAEAVDSVLQGVTDSVGANDKAFGIWSTSNSARMARASNQMQSATQQIGEVLLPVIATAMTMMGALFSAFSNLPEGMQTAIIGVLAFVAVLGPTMLIVGKLITGVGLAIQGIVKLAAVMKILGSSALLANPWVLAIVAALAGIALVVLHWETLQEWFAGFFDWFRRTAGRVIDWLSDNWQTVAAILTGPVGIAVLAITKHWDAIQDGARAAARFAVDQLGSIVSFIRGMPDRVASAARGMFDGIANAFISAINVLIRAWNSLRFTVPTISLPFGGQVGGQTIGVPAVPEIPRLDVGGLIRADGLAMVHRGEAVLPAAVVSSPFDAASLPAGSSSMRPIEVVLEVDGRRLGRVLVDEMADRERRTGRPAFGRSGGRRI